MTIYDNVGNTIKRELTSNERENLIKYGDEKGFNIKLDILNTIFPRVTEITRKYGLTIKQEIKHYHVRIILRRNLLTRCSIIKIHTSYISIRIPSKGYYPCVNHIAKYISEEMGKNVKINWR